MTTRRGHFARLSFYLSGALFLTGCAGTETGNPPDPSSTLRLGLHTSDATLASWGDQGIGYRIIDARIGVSTIALIGCDDSSSLLEAASPGINLSAPSDPMMVKPGSYCGIQLVLAPTDLGYSQVQPLAPPRLSMAVRGTDPTGTEFSIEWIESVSILLEPPQGASLDITPGDSLLLSLDVAKAVHVFQLQERNLVPGSLSEVPSEDPIVLDLAFALYVDENDDGELQPEEASAPVASAWR